MTEHSGLPVEGYNLQTSDNIARANRLKQLEERVMRELDTIFHDTLCGEIHADLNMAETAVRDIQQGFMWAVRSIFKPSRIRLPED